MKTIIVVLLPILLYGAHASWREHPQKSRRGGVLFAGQRYDTVQECIHAAAAFSPSGTCEVLNGTPNNSQIEMASGVTLSFDRGSFVNTSAQGGQSSFVHFARTVKGATLRGKDLHKTTLKNSATGPQFGAVVEDEGVGNTVCDLTLDGNGNSTDTLLDSATVKSNNRNLLLIGDLTQIQGHSYSWDIRGGTDIYAHQVEIRGGSLDAVQLTTRDSVGVYGSIGGGRFTDIYAHDSPRNGLDFNANGRHQSISGTVWRNIRLEHNGTVDDGTDDEYGLALFATAVGDSSIEDNTFLNLIATHNKGSGIRLKGNVIHNLLAGVVSEANGIGRRGSVQQDSIQLVTELDTVGPTKNWIQGSSRRTGSTKALRTDRNTSDNTFILIVGSDPVALGNMHDFCLLPSHISQFP